MDAGCPLGTLEKAWFHRMCWQNWPLTDQKPDHRSTTDRRILRAKVGSGRWRHRPDRHRLVGPFGRVGADPRLKQVTYQLRKLNCLTCLACKDASVSRRRKSSTLFAKQRLVLDTNAFACHTGKSKMMFSQSRPLYFCICCSNSID